LGDTREHLRKVCEILESGGVRYWLESGTLLGVVREGKVLPWDHDIDIGVWAEDFPKLRGLRRTFRRAGYRLWPTKSCPPYQMELRGGPMPVHIEGYLRAGDEAVSLVLAKKQSKRLDLHVAVFLMRTLGDPMWMVGRRPWKRVISAYHRAVPFDLLADTTEHESGLRVPVDPEKYLAYRYGSDWRTPKKNWRVSHDGAWRRGLPPREYWSV
jgi:hypothetical protein